MKYAWKSLCMTVIAFVAAATIANADDSANLAASTPARQTVATYHIQDIAPVPEADEPGMDEAMDMDVMMDEPEGAAEEEEADDGPVRLFNPWCGIQVGGWVSSGIYYNGDGRRGGNGDQPLGFRNIAGEYTLDQSYIYAEKLLPDDPCCHDWGFRADFIFGADGPDTQAFGDIGWDTEWDTSRTDNQGYGSAIPQLYAEYGNSDLSVKAGHFYTLIGYEVVTAPDNFFYSHAYTMFYGEPFTHTGVLVSKAVNDQISVTGGWTMGWDSGFNNANDASTFLGNVSWTSCDERMTWTYGVVAGDFGNGDVGNQGDIYMHSIVGTYAINECTEYVFQSDYGNNTNSADGNTTWGGVNQYLFHTINSCYKLGMRAEWFSDPDGVRVGQGTGDYYAVSTGVNYTPNSNVIVRPEVRYDWFRGNGEPYNPDAAGNGQSKDQFYYGFDVILLY